MPLTRGTHRATTPSDRRLHTYSGRPGGTHRPSRGPSSRLPRSLRGASGDPFFSGALPGPGPLALPLILSMVVCPAHQAGMTASDLVTDEGWTQIVHAFSLDHRALPDRATLGLAWKRPEVVPHAFEPTHTNAIAGEVQRDDALRPRRGVR